MVSAYFPAGAFAVLAGMLSLAVIPWLPDGGVVKWLVLALALQFLPSIRSLDKVDFVAIGLLAWVGVTLAWSPDPLFGSYRLLQCAVLTVLFLGLRRYSGAVAPGAVVAVLIAVISTDWFLHGTFRNENFLAEFVILCLPFTLLHWLGWPVALFAAAFLFFQDDSRTEWAALGGLAGLWAWWWLSRRSRFAGLVAFGLVGVASVFAGWFLIQDGAALYRVQLWVNTFALWAQQPFFGIGLGGFDYLYPQVSQVDRMLVGGASRIAAESHLFAGAAHNDVLQLLAECGVVGGGLALALLYMCAGGPIDSPRKRAAFASLGLAAGIAAVEFPLQNPGTGAVMVLALATLRPAHQQPGWLARIPVAVFAAVAGLVFTLGAAGNSWFAITAKELNRRPVVALEANARAYELAPWDKAIRLQLFRTLAEVQRTTPAVIETETAERVWGISKSAVPYNPGLLIDRIGYLARVGRCSGECGDLLARMTGQTMVRDVAKLVDDIKAGGLETRP